MKNVLDVHYPRAAKQNIDMMTLLGNRIVSDKPDKPDQVKLRRWYFKFHN